MSGGFLGVSRKCSEAPWVMGLIFHGVIPENVRGNCPGWMSG